MSRPTKRQAAFALLALVAALVATAPAFSSPVVSAKQAEAQRVLGQIRQIDSSLDKAVDAYNAAQMRLDAVRAEQRQNKRHLTIARSNFTHSQAALAARLVALYQGDDASVLEVMLGSTSLQDLLDRVDTISRVSDQDVRIIGEIRRYRHEIKVRERRLAQARAEQEQVVAERAARRRDIESQLAERRRLLSSIKSEIERIKAQEAERQKRLQAQAAQRLQEQQQQQQQEQQQQVSAPAGSTSSPAPDGASVSSPPPATNGGVVGIAMQYLGVPYVWGGASPSGFDCSGLIMYVYAQVGISLPHNAAMQYGYGSPVSRDQLAPGDLVFFDGLGHNGIYIGGNQFIHAPHTGDVVKISSITGWYASTFVGARRL